MRFVINAHVHINWPQKLWSLVEWRMESEKPFHLMNSKFEIVLDDDDDDYDDGGRQ